MGPDPATCSRRTNWALMVTWVPGRSALIPNAMAASRLRYVYPQRGRAARRVGFAAASRTPPWLVGGISSPSVPTAAPAAFGGSEDEPEEPHHQHDDGDPPQRLEGEPRAEEDQRQQQDQKQGDHCVYL